MNVKCPSRFLSCLWYYVCGGDAFSVFLQVEALKGALAALSEGRSGVASEAGPDASGGPENHLTITRGRKLAARVAELSSALEVNANDCVLGRIVGCDTVLYRDEVWGLLCAAGPFIVKRAMDSDPRARLLSYLAAAAAGAGGCINSVDPGTHRSKPAC